MGISPVAVYSEADALTRHVMDAEESVCLGPAPVADSYLRQDRILQAALDTGAAAIHPGYGFLSENDGFAEACEKAGIVFLGPTPEQIRLFGKKHTAREIAARCQAPLLPGTGLLGSLDEALEAAGRLGYPVMLKSTAGGGGIGMRLCRTPDELKDGFVAVERMSRAHFKDGGLFLEKFIEWARHVEVQIFGDGQGKVIALGERDCSVQRRNQKVIEETPAPLLPDAIRAAMWDTAVRLGTEVSYRSAGTVEFIFDATSQSFYFLEVNTRLQVEHGVTEQVTGLDLVEWMVCLGAQSLPPLDAVQVQPRGASIQVRLYAEDPARGFQPCSGLLTHVSFPSGVRCDTWVEAGTDVTPFYDPMLAKVIVDGTTREEAIANLRVALDSTELAGFETNLEYLKGVVASEAFQSGHVTTRLLNDFAFDSHSIEVMEPGTLTTVQDYPGRLGFWDVGVPPSGPMDALSFRLGNRLLGNEDGAPGLECSILGPALRFASATRIVLTGADMQARLNDQPAARWQVLTVQAGDLLELGGVEGAGARAYILFDGGLKVPNYLGSASTFTLGQFGGHGGRALRAGDVLHLAGTSSSQSTDEPALPEKLIPALTRTWTIGVLYGPHGAPDYFTREDIASFFATGWKVHHNSSRTGVRLIGPKPKWARKDGGEAGLHPSNIHDNAYAVGTVDFTGDMPIILGPDGPSLGGFVCPATIVQADLWKIGQLAPGNEVRFVALTEPQAAQLEQQLEAAVSTLAEPLPSLPSHEWRDSESLTPVLRAHGEGNLPRLALRADGDRNLLLEYGEPVLDLNLRFRVHALMDWFHRHRPEGVIDLTPGIRSLQIHYDSRLLKRERLLDLLEQADAALPGIDDMVVPTRTVHLPLSWDDPSTRLAIEKYMRSVRPDAPWCPSNIEFIRRINGLQSIEQVRDIVFGASYLVMGLGDVYLGAPVATPLDPRHRLVTTKYNPARTWTPENAVGIGGAYLCVYGMEGPGGYQFVGRTVQMWNTHRTTSQFTPGHPWLLRFFDQIRFYPVEAEELLDMRRRFPLGKFEVPISEETFSLREYNAFLREIKESADCFKQTQRQAFQEERERWAAAGDSGAGDSIAPEPEPAQEITLPPGSVALRAPTTASVWRVEVKPGESVRRGQKLLILEAMKMEIAIAAPADGQVSDVLISHGAHVLAGQSLLVLQKQNGTH